MTVKNPLLTLEKALIRKEYRRTGLKENLIKKIKKIIISFD